MTDEERRQVLARKIEEALIEKWPQIDELWMREIQPLFRGQISDEDFITRIATPLSLRLVSMGIQAAILGVTAIAPVFDNPFELVVAPSGAVSVRFLSPQP